MPWAKIKSCLGVIDADKPFRSRVLREVFVGKSTNNAGFLAAIIHAEGLLAPADASAHEHVPRGDWVLWEVSLLSEEEAGQQGSQGLPTTTAGASTSEAASARQERRAAMRKICSPADVAMVEGGALRALLTRRFAEILIGGEPYDPQTYGWFLIVEQGDEPGEAREHGCSFPLLPGPGDGGAEKDEDFVPPFEWVTDWGFCFEAVILLSDGGDFIAMIVPRLPGVDARLLALAAQQKAGDDDQCGRTASAEARARDLVVSACAPRPAL